MKRDTNGKDSNRYNRYESISTRPGQALGLLREEFHLEEELINY